MSALGYLILESGESYSGLWLGGQTERAGEVVFNTSHSGYEEIATDPSYYSQIVVMTASQQGNYGIDRAVWESENIWIRGFICLEMQKSQRDNSWLNLLTEKKIPVLSEVDTRSLVLSLREKGTTWGALVNADNLEEAQRKAKILIKKEQDQPSDWTQIVSNRDPVIRQGQNPKGPKVAVLDFGTKENILRELQKRCREIQVFPSGTTAEAILNYKPDGIFLTNGPGDPADVHSGIETVKGLLGKKFIFGICMGHQILALALGAKTYKLKYGHRGSNHPVLDKVLNKIYVTSQNHGYNVDHNTLPTTTQLTHINLNDQTDAGIYDPEMKCMSVQFHPESHPGPHDAVELFDIFIKKII